MTQSEDGLRMSTSKRAVFFLVIVSIALGSARDSRGSTAIPEYELELDFEPAEARLSGRALVRIPSSAIDSGVARFDIAYSDWLSVTVNRVLGSSGKELTYSVQNSGRAIEIEVTNPDPRITIDYSFPVPASSRERYGYYVFSDSPLFPEVLQRDGSPHPFADFRVQFEYPSSLAVLTTGGEGDLRADGDRTTATYVATHVSGFAIVAGEGFEVTRHADSVVPVVAFYDPQYSDEFSIVVERTIEAASWYKETYGFFPLEQIGIVQGHPTWSGGYALPNMFNVHLGNLSEGFITWITAHELGHYYWGHTVLGENKQLGWLLLSLGIWADQLYLAERDGLSMAEQWRRSGRSFRRYFAAMLGNHDQRLGLPREEVRELGFDYNSYVRHGKAAVGAYLQSLLIGRERFLDLQRQILEEFRGRQLRESDFVSLLSEFGSENAREFYDAWRRGDATIGLKISSVMPADVDDQWKIEVKRTGTVPYPIEIEAASKDGRRVSHQIRGGAKDDEFTIDFYPVEILIDPQGLIPMVQSSHSHIQAHHVIAHEWVGLDRQFLLLGQELLARHPEADHVRYRLTRRLCDLARWEEAIDLWAPERAMESRDGVLAALFVARALARAGRTAEALDRLDDLRAPSKKFGELRRWEAVRNEADP